MSTGTSKHLRGRIVGADLVPEFMPKRNSEPNGNGGLTADAVRVSRLARSGWLDAARSTPALVFGRVFHALRSWHDPMHAFDRRHVGNREFTIAS